MAIYVKKKKNPWTDEEVALLRQGIVPEGRSAVTAKAKAKSLGITLFDCTGAHSRWTREDLRKLKKGEKPEGRSEEACIAKGIRLNLEVTFTDGVMHVEKKKLPDRRRKLLARAKEYARRKDSGESLAEIGRRDGVSRQRVNEIIGSLSSIR